MRPIVILGAALAVLVLPQSSAQAQTNSWCANMNVGFNTSAERCGFKNFETCQAYVRSFGTTSFCTPRFWGSPGPVARGAKKNKKRYVY
jgi:hypothetical protein